MKKSTAKSQNIGGIPIISLGGQLQVSGVKYTLGKFDQDTPWHVHDTAVVSCLESGLMGVRTDHKTIVLSPGMMCYMPADISHLEKGMGTDIAGWYLTIPREQTHTLPKNSHVMELSDLLFALSKRIVSWGEAKIRTPSQERLVKAFLDELENSRKTHHLSIPFPERASLRLIAKKIMNRPEDMNTVSYWAKKAGMSKRSFTRRFSEEAGISFVLWRQRVKMHSALIGLSSRKAITEIAFDLGYQNVSSFTAIFRKQFGVSPTRYMKEGKNL